MPGEPSGAALECRDQVAIQVRLHTATKPCTGLSIGPRSLCHSPLPR